MALTRYPEGLGPVTELLHEVDWSATSMGAMDSWPATVRSLVGSILASPVPMVTLWGEEGVMVYNDAYATVAGERHPVVLGMPVRAAWPEAADFNDQVMHTVLAGGTLSYVRQELMLHRGERPERAWMTLDYSPIMDDAGAINGVLAVVQEVTDAVLAERRVAGEHARLEAMFDQAPGFVAMLSGPQHTFTMVNKAYTSLIDGRDVMHRTVADALPEAAAQGFLDLLDRIYSSGEPYTGVAQPFTVLATDGRPARTSYVDFIYQPLRNDEGKVFGIFVQGADVTDRVLAERAVHDSEATFRTLAQVMPNHVWAAGADGTLDWFNDRTYEYSGAVRGQLDGEGWAAIVHPDDLARVGAQWSASVAGGTDYETEFRIRRADGSYRWHIVRAAQIRLGDGSVTRWIGTNTDIDDQKAAAETLANLNEALEHKVSLRTAERDRMWRLSSDIMLVVDNAHRIVAANPALRSQLGWLEDDCVGQPLLSLVHPDDHAATLALWSASGEGAFRLENRFACAGGGYRSVAWTGAPEDQYVYAVGRDVTAEKEAVAASKHAELALQHAQKMESIGNLTGGVAHDFNNLLQVISGNLQMIATDVVGNARAERRVHQALEGVSRGARLASYLLAFGRRQALEPKVIQVGRLMEAMEDMLRRTLGEECEIGFAIADGLWNCCVDVAQVESAVLNLCINARDAMDGGGRLTIETSNAVLDEEYARGVAEAEAGDYVMIAVSDTGTGMTPDVMRQAFDPFFSTKPEGKGTGLGLSMVYGFARQSGGHVRIYSEVGHGTTVKLYLPRSCAKEEAVCVIDTTVVGGSETILVVEDDDGVRETTVEMLGDLGYQVLKAHDAASALAIINSGMPIDLLFTDVVMPGTLRSPELAAKARARLPGIAVLFTSGYAENAIVHGGRLDAGVELLGKPYTRSALARKIRHVLAGPAQRAVVAQALAAPLPPAASSAPQNKGRRILLVEDDEAIRLTTGELLGCLGHEVTLAASAEEALAMLDQGRVDLLITDLGLPCMDGETLATHFHARLPQAGVIIASGSLSDSAVGKAVRLLKPFSLDALMQAVEKAAP